MPLRLATFSGILHRPNCPKHPCAPFASPHCLAALFRNRFASIWPSFQRVASISAAMATAACCTPAPPATPECQGRDELLSGHQVYATGSPASPAAVILICDVFGYEAPLLRKLADKVAAAGYYALVPDVLQGDPFTGSFAAGDFAPWMARHHPAGVPAELTKGLVEALKDKGIAAIGIAGFCWGAKVAATVGKEKGTVKAMVQLHPSFVEAADYEEVAVPIMTLAAPTDGVEKHEEVLAKRTDVKSFVKIFPDVKHGWTVRYDETNEIAVEQANEAHSLMLDWFAKYL